MRKRRFIAEQGRKPTGLLGQIVARVMAKQTAGANDFALKLLQLRPDDAVLEIGPGHWGHPRKGREYGLSRFSVRDRLLNGDACISWMCRDTSAWAKHHSRFHIVFEAT
jgi:hypothetical protein